MHRAYALNIRFLYAIVLFTLIILTACSGQPAATQTASVNLGNTL